MNRFIRVTLFENALGYLSILLLILGGLIFGLEAFYRAQGKPESGGDTSCRRVSSVTIDLNGTRIFHKPFELLRRKLC